MSMQPRFRTSVEDIEKERHDGSTIVDASDIGHCAPHSGVPDSLMNTVQLTPAQACVDSSSLCSCPLRMKCTLRGPGPFQVFGMGGGEAQPSNSPMDEVLQWCGRRLVAITLDASSPPTTESGQVTLPPVDLPFSPSAIKSSMCLSQLTELRIITNRKVSCTSLLGLLCYTPALQSLFIHNRATHRSVFPENCENLSAVSLPYLSSLELIGLSSDAASEILSKLVLRDNTRIGISLLPGDPSQTPYALRHVLSKIRHVRVSYTALGQGEEGKHLYRLTFSDAEARIQVHWDWEVPQGVSVCLFRIALAPGRIRALPNVQELTVNLYHVEPSVSDWATILRPFPSLRRVDLHFTPAGPDTQGTLACGCRTATFWARASPILRKVVDVPLMFALGLARRVDGLRERKTFSGEKPPVFGSPLRKGLYAFAWKYMVRDV